MQIYPKESFLWTLWRSKINYLLLNKKYEGGMSDLFIKKLGKYLNKVKQKDKTTKHFVKHDKEVYTICF